MFSISPANFLIAISFLASARATCLHNTYLMRREEGKIPLPTFSYSGSTGPVNWAGLNENNTACATGSTQSPIVLTDAIPFATTQPKWSIANVHEAEFENLGSTLEVILEGSLDFEGTVYNLKQFHMHTPSEHRIREEYYPLEVHFVHQSEAGDITVVGIPFELSEDGKTTALLTETIKNLADVVEPATATKTGPLDFSEVIGAVSHQHLFQYKGSLTTPPCKEGVQFLILENPLPIDVKTYNAIKKVMKFNSRFTQNTPGETNVIALAQQQAGGASNNETVGATTVNVDELMAAFLSSGKKMKYQTVTKTETTVELVEDDGEVPEPTPTDIPIDIPTDIPVPTDGGENSTSVGEETTSTEAPVGPIGSAPTDLAGELIKIIVSRRDSQVETETDGGMHAPGPVTPHHVRARRSNMAHRRA